ncbi:MAG: hypothetical protein HDR88_17885 [Bacteroides sp.]|nr:hypothetical protein [Bacteroides sp.]
MRKNFLFVLTLGGLLFNASAAVPFQKGMTAPKHRSLGITNIMRAPATQTLLNEDFSGFSGGSEDDPGEEIEYVNGYHIPDELTTVPGWTGGGIFPTGGSIALKKRSINNNLGFISTPPMYLGGTATLTFRARCLPGSTGSSLWIALCDDYYGPGDDQENFKLTEDWETYTMVATHAELDEMSYFQLQAEKGFVQIDDVKIDFVRDRLPSPYAYNAINLSPTEFVASWEECDVPTYRLNVVCKELAPVDKKGKLAETFDGISVNADNSTINLSNPNYPEGWEINLSPNGTKDVSLDVGNYHSAPLSLVFDAEGDAITTAETPYPIDGLKFWVKPSQMEDDETIMSLLRVEIYHSLTGVWENIAHLPYYWMTSDGDFYEMMPEALGEDVTRVRLSMIQKGKVDFFIDDVELSYSSKGETYYVIKDLDIEDTEYTVSGINPENEYSYYVLSVDGDLVSEPSYVIWVDGITGLKPEAMEATDVTATSFTANWKQLGHATNYKVETSFIIRADEDMPGVVVLEENFDGITNSGTDWVSPYNFAEHGMTSTGWSATQPAWQPGMAGTQGTSWIGTAGLVYSPNLNLSGNAGEGFDVEATVVTTVESIEDGSGNVYEEGVYVMVLNTPFDSQAVTAALIDTPTVGSHTAKVHVPNPEGADLSNIIVAFMNKTGTAFYVDDVCIMQDLRKGEELIAPLSIGFSEGTSLHVGDIRKGSDHAYSITASTRRNYEDFVSETSDMMTVATSTVGVNKVEAELSGVSVSVANGILSINASEDFEICVYSAEGVLKAQAIGTLSKELPQGIYIVKAGEYTAKVFVR